MKAMREHCRQLMDQQPPVTTVQDFCARLGAGRGRPVVLVPFTPAPGDPSGVWLKGGAIDYIFYSGATGPVHQEAIIWHELAHLLLDHPGPVLDDTQTRLLFPDLEPAVVRHMLQRGSYSLPAERDAERLASLLMVDLDRRRRARRPRLEPDSPLHRLKNALNFQDAED